MQTAMSALHPIATAKADMRQWVMSALHLKADMCSATSDVGYGPIADISIDHFVSHPGYAVTLTASWMARQ
jgi:hypothetical protein